MFHLFLQPVSEHSFYYFCSLNSNSFIILKSLKLLHQSLYGFFLKIIVVY